MIDKKSFLEIVKNFSREDFRNYLYNDINRKLKKVSIVIIVDSNDINRYKTLI